MEILADATMGNQKKTKKHTMKKEKNITRHLQIYSNYLFTVKETFQGQKIMRKKHQSNHCSYENR